MTKPSAAGWYWFRGPAHEADPFIVQVDDVGQFQWPAGGFQEVTLARGEWASEGREGNSQTMVLAHSMRTMKQCSFHVRSEGQFGCSP